MKIKAYHKGRYVYIIGFCSGKNGEIYALYYSENSHVIDKDLHDKFAISL